jgi:glycerol-3-phosphate dehydrogenase
MEALGAWLPAPLLRRLAGAYGTRIESVLGDAESIAALGRHFGAGLYEAEVRYLIGSEFARTAEDILWRRTKLGLAMSKAEQKALADWVGTAVAARR